LKHELYVDDNYDYMDEDERYKAGEFDTIEEAITAAKKIVDDFLLSVYQKRPYISPEELYAVYKRSGEDPWIHPNYSDYNSWNYAEYRCREICGSTRSVRHKKVFKRNVEVMAHSIEEIKNIS